MNTEPEQVNMESTQMNIGTKTVLTPVKAKASEPILKTPPQNKNDNPEKTPEGIRVNETYFARGAPYKKKQKTHHAFFPIMEAVNEHYVLLPFPIMEELN